MIYDAWGFTENPFTTRPLQADDVGERLLVGRQDELEKLGRRLGTPPKCVTVEGANGVGKTSLVNVAVHRAHASFVRGEGQDLLIPCSRTFQLEPGSTADDFAEGVLHEVAQTLLKNTTTLKENMRALPPTHAVSRWLNSPQLSSWQGGLQVLVAGLSGGRTQETNTSQGFSRSGFRKLVEEWLSAAFPGGLGGGVVCVLDNLELLETSARARQLLEALRDKVLTISGIRWVLCGSAGIVRSVASTPRLEGLLHDPVDVRGIEDRFAADVLTSRVLAFSKGGQATHMPLLASDFEELYRLLHSNMRNTLAAADSYCMWVADEKRTIATDNEKKSSFAAWLDRECRTLEAAADRGLGNRAWETFEKAVELGGEFSPSDYREFGFESVQALRPSVRDLEGVGLLQSSQDEIDQRRKTILVTAKGWMVWRVRQQERSSGASSQNGQQPK